MNAPTRTAVAALALLIVALLACKQPSNYPRNGVEIRVTTTGSNDVRRFATCTQLPWLPGPTRDAVVELDEGLSLVMSTRPAWIQIRRSDDGTVLFEADEKLLDRKRDPLGAFTLTRGASRFDVEVGQGCGDAATTLSTTETDAGPRSPNGDADEIPDGGDANPQDARNEDTEMAADAQLEAPDASFGDGAPSDAAFD